jgi:hypothetical protein
MEALYVTGLRHADAYRLDLYDLDLPCSPLHGQQRS